MLNILTYSATICSGTFILEQKFGTSGARPRIFKVLAALREQIRRARGFGADLKTVRSSHAGRGVTRKAGTWPPPDVTLARPVALSRVRKPESLPRKRYGAKSTSMSL